MLPEIGGDVGDAKGTIGVAIIFVGADEGLQRSGMKLIPTALLGEKGLGCASGIEFQGVNHSAVNDGVVGIELGGLLERIDGGFDLAVFLENEPEGVSVGGFARVELRRGLGGGEGFVDAAEVVEAEGENVMCVGAVRVECDGAVGGGDAVFGAGEVAKKPGAIGPTLGPLRTEFEELVEGG